MTAQLERARAGRTRRSLFSGLALKRSPVSRIHRRRHRCGMAVFRPTAASPRLASPTHRASSRRPRRRRRRRRRSGIQRGQLRSAATLVAFGQCINTVSLDMTQRMSNGICSSHLTQSAYTPYVVSCLVLFIDGCYSFQQLLSTVI